MRKRFLSALLALSMCSGLVVPASAAEASGKALTLGTAVYDEVLDTWEAQHQSNVSFNADGSTKITGKEWLKDSETVGLNRERAHAQFVPYQDANAGLAAEKSVLDTVGNETSDYYQLLSGKKWDFSLVRNPAEAEKKDAAYLAETYTGSDFTPEYVPQAWQTYRNEDGTFKYFDEPMYTNHPFPWIGNFEAVDYNNPSAPTSYNPVGYYRTTFETPATWDGRETFISLQSVESAYYLYINGKCVGYSTDGFTAHDFNITEYLKPAGQKNTLSMKVFRWSIGSWLENQDFIRESGIYRDVYLYSKGEAEIRDFFVKTAFEDRTSVDSDVDVTVETDVRGLSNATNGTYTVSAYLVDDAGTTVATAADQTVEIAAAAGKTSAEKLRDAGTKVINEFTVTNPKKWFSDTPNLYRLVLQIKKGDSLIETAVQRIGFREIYKTILDSAKNNEQIQITGQQLILRGTNRHDTDLEKGHALDFEAYKKDLMLMKQMNINAIRTSHYPNDKALYNLADELGIYVCNEANVESHRAAQNGIQVPTGPQGSNGLAAWVAPVLDRNANMLERYKNSSSVVIWSLGNEATYSKPNLTNEYSFWVSSLYLLARDPSRIRKYEREDTRGYTRPAGTDPWSTEARKNSMVDVLSSQYRTPAGTVNYNSQLPYLHSEYNHAMGQAYGNAKEHWDAIRSNDAVQGGFIWDWIDQSRETTKDSNGDGVNETFWGYGGDWIDPVANDNAFCGNGIAYADRTAGPMTLEARKVHQQVNFYLKNTDPVAPGEAINIQVVNEFENTSLDAFEITYRLTQDSETELATGTLSLNTPAMKGSRLTNTESGGNAETFPIALPDFAPVEGSDYLLDISVKSKGSKPWAEANSEIAYEQFELSVKNKAPLSPSGSVSDFATSDQVGNTLTLTGTTDEGQSFSIKLNTNTGELTEYALDGNVVMTAGPELSLWRPQTYNEAGMSAWGLPLQNAGDPRNMTNQNVVVDKTNNKVTMTASGTLKVDADSAMTYEVYGNGDIVVQEQFLPKSNFASGGLPKVGTRMIINGDYSDFSWYGRGPWESYSDRKSGARVGTYESTVAEQYDMKLLKPQENGNHTDVRWTSLTNSAGTGLLVSAGNGNVVEVAALHNTAEEINGNTYNDADNRHPQDIKPREDIVWSIDLRQDGVGDTGFSSAYPIDKYHIFTDQNYVYSYRISPISEGTDAMAKSKQSFDVEETEYQVSAIQVNGVNIPSFSPVSREITYEIPATDGSAVVTATSTGEVTITTNPKTGTVTVMSIGANDAVETYTIRLVRAKQLQTGSGVFGKVATNNEYSGNRATNLIDGNKDTFWDYNWSGNADGVDMSRLYYAVELKEPTIISSVGYMPRQDSGNNGNFLGHEIYVSTKPISELNVGKDLVPNLKSGDWTKVSEGIWDSGKGWKDDPVSASTPVQTILVQPVSTVGSKAPPSSSFGNGAETRVSALRSAKDATIELEASYALTGGKVEPDPKITAKDGTKLIQGVDYTLAYENNTAEGSASVTINYQGQFHGDPVTKTFTVTQPAAEELVFGLAVNGTKLSDFVYTTDTYNYALAFNTKDVVVTADVAPDADYTVAMTNGGAKVTATKSTTTKTYTINMTRGLPSASVGGTDTFSAARAHDTHSASSTANMFDSKAGTYWENSWSEQTLREAYVALELKDAAPLTALQYLPRQAADQKNGRFLGYEVYVSPKPISELIVNDYPTAFPSADWTLAGSGTWASDIALKTAALDVHGIRVKTVLLQPTSTDGKSEDVKDSFGCVAEITVTQSSNAADAYITLPDTAPLVAGSAEPAPTVMMGGIKLQQGVDYTVEYANNTVVGQTATATITYMGTFVGAPPVTKSFTVGDTAAMLASPTNLAWDGVKATWDAVENASRYSVQLYKDGAAIGSAYSASGLEKSFAGVISESGSYTFTVKAVGDGISHGDSLPSAPSAPYEYAAKYTVRLNPGYGFTLAAATGSESPVAAGGSYSFTLTLADDYSASVPVIKVNGTTELTETEHVDNVYSYTISDIYENQSVSVTGVAQNTYVISFIVGDTTVAEKKVKQGGSLTLNNFPKVPAKTGYTGVWDRTEYFETVMQNETVTAVYTANTYAVTFDANGGQVSPDSMEVTFDAPYGELPVPTTEDEINYIFDGWFTLAEGGSIISGEDLVRIAEDHTLYAHWTDQETSEAPVASITGMPDKVTLPYEGEGIALSVAEADTYTYMWSRMTDGENWEELEGETSATYTIPAADIVFANSGWQYQCVVTNTEDGKKPNTADSLPVTLTVAKGFRSSPDGLTGVPPTTVGGSDAAIGGLKGDGLYEFKMEDGAYTPVPAGSESIDGLVSGTYFVRFIETIDYNASDDTTVVIPEDSSGMVTGITLDQTSATLYSNRGSGTLQLTATISPEQADNKNVSWTTDAPEVATVDASGLVTIHANGEATITATTVDGGFKASCVVTVRTYKPSSGGSSESGGDTSDTDDKTETNADGSVTKTQTDKTTGTVTETTAYPNGDKSVVETKKDGTVTEKLTRKDGYQSETVRKSDGSSTSQVTDEKGVKTQSETSSEGQTTAQVTLPKNVETAKVTIPVKNAGITTVAVIVKADGTEEIIKTSISTKEGVVLTVNGDVKVKLVDNAKHFTDVAQGHWASDAVNFVTSRELFGGTSEGVFSLNTNMGRGMLFTTLARLDGVDTAGGELWYSKAMDWAVSAGISDGSSPTATLTREQLVTMLYRYAEQPKADGAEKTFADSDSISAWAAEPMDWAVKSGILTGKDGNRLDPTGTATRAEVATILMRFIENK